MKSPTASRDKKGFTLIEILTALSIVTILFVAGSFVSFDSYNRELVSTEHKTLVSILEKARNRAMNNIYASRHGVRIENNAFILFRESPYDEEVIIRNKNVTNLSTLSKVVFEQLSGETSNTGDIVLSDGPRTKKVLILANGLIDW